MAELSRHAAAREQAYTHVDPLALPAVCLASVRWALTAWWRLWAGQGASLAVARSAPSAG